MEVGSVGGEEDGVVVAVAVVVAAVGVVVIGRKSIPVGNVKMLIRGEKKNEGI